jgi:hypothetical protein
MLELSRDGEVFVLRMQGGENRMQPDFVHAWNAALDEVEGASGPAALVTAADGMLALAHDFRVMRADRGFFRLPEVDMAMKRGFSDGMTAVLRARLPAVTLHEAMVTGRRYGGAEAVARPTPAGRRRGSS